VIVEHTVAGIRSAGSRRLRAVVMTMGALHEGHATLIREARESVGETGTVLVSVFVNPTQFGAGEDFDRYPRTLETDVVIAEAAGADTVFAPDAEAVYGPARGFEEGSVTVDPGPLGEILEGASRPGHFRGVLTVVAKLLGMTRPDVALFGEKDYQQLVLIRRMVDDLSMPVEVVGVPTVRDADGLAMSSRNRFLSPDERALATAIPRALDTVERCLTDGVDAAVAQGMDVLRGTPGVDVDYLTVTGVDLGPAPVRGPARALIAANVGSTRLIDNRAVTVAP
jgi:pantoate--beta-alanine ligase